jgi:integrase
MAVVKRGSTYHFDSAVAGTRYRCSLGTSDAKAASRLENRIGFALADGPRSQTWAELKTVLPVASFKHLTEGVLPDEPLKLTELEENFLTHSGRREKLEQISASTLKNYQRTSKVFFDWLLEQKLSSVDQLTPEVVETYLLRRKETIAAKGGSGRGIITDLSVLSRLFDFAVEEGWLAKSPLKYKPKLPVVTEPVQPFTDEEMLALEAVEKSDEERVVFAVLKYTGLRCGDVCDLLWTAFDFKTWTLRWRTTKRGKLVEIPLAQPMMSAVHSYKIEGEPRVFPDLKPNKLYRMVRGWGEKAGVENCHPHRWRHTAACRWLAKGLTLFDVAKLLGDTHGVVDKHYAKWTNGQQERVRGIMNLEEEHEG